MISIGRHGVIGTNLTPLPPLKPHNHGNRLNFSDRPFVAWDGEGVTYSGDVQQSYVLWGCSTGDRIIKPVLHTRECLDLLLEVERSKPEAIHVGFAMQYDVNMILRDIGRDHLEQLYTSNYTKWQGYRLFYFPNKWFQVVRDNTRVKLFDVFSFFQSSFVKACEKFLGENDPELERIREGKQARSSFAFDELEMFIIPYWEGELRLLLRLMESLRGDLHAADLRVSSWHGPGSVANAVFQQFAIGRAKHAAIPEVARAAQFAYAGGRFEQFRAGHYGGSVYEYDINSAYPSAIRELPSLQHGAWERVETFVPDSFGVWYLEHHSQVSDSMHEPWPLFYRDSRGRVSFPVEVQGWYWTPEAALAPESVQYGYVWRDNGSKPFRFVEDMYLTRKRWKQEGNSAERALKLALNSLYGKMAQRIGGKDGPPKWHQLEWAGYVTSHCRAKLYQAIRQAPNDVVAVETDAVFSMVPLDLPIGDGLGEWSVTEFDWVTYVQSGFYFGGQGEWITEKYRGFDRGSVSHASVLDHFQNPTTPLEGETTRFVGMGIALHTAAVWRSWETRPRGVVVGGGGKRSHVSRQCHECRAGASLTESLHHLSVRTSGGRSFPHSLPWNDGEDWEGKFATTLELW